MQGALERRVLKEKIPFNSDRSPGKDFKVIACKQKEPEKRIDTGRVRDKSVDLLQKLKHFLENKNDESCEEVLKTIFDISVQRVNFNRSEKKEICITLIKTADDIFTFLFNFGFDFDPMYGLLLLKFRSAVELMFQVYSKFPRDGGNLLQVLNKLKENTDTLKVLDEAVEKFHKKYLDVGFTTEDLYRPANIPKDHKWWLEKM